MATSQTHGRGQGLSLGLAMASLALAAGLLLASPAAAKKPGNPVRGGKVFACYKAKGKASGSMRVLIKGKRCKRGERKLIWSIAGGAPGAPGPAGSPGAPGPQGSPGSSGTDGTDGTDGSADEGDATAIAGLETKVASLSLEVETLEQLLAGVQEGDLVDLLDKLDGLTNADLTGAVSKLEGLTNADLTGAVSKLEGLTNADLTGAVSKLSGVTGTQLDELVDQLPVIDSLCTRVGGLTSGLDEVNQGIKLLTVLGLPSLSLGNLTALPNSLPSSYVCPS